MNSGEFIDQLFMRAKAEGCENCEVYESGADSFSVSVYQGEVDQYSANTSYGLSFRGVWNGKMGYASTEALDEEAIGMLVREAKANAASIQSDDVQTLYDGSGEYGQAESYSPDLDRVDPADKIALAKDMETLSRALDSRVIQVPYCRVSTASGSVRIKNTLGLDKKSRSNYAVAILAPLLKQGEKTANGVSVRVTQDFSSLHAQEMAGEAVREGVDFLSARPIPSGGMPVAFRPDAAADLLDCFAGIFSAEEAQKGLSLLKGREGQTVGSKNLTIIDDPLMEGGLETTPFDDEGLPTRTKKIIDAGKLTTLLHNLKTATKAGVASTGNARKPGYAGAVKVGGFNFHIQPGALSPDELLREMGRGLFVTELAGLHSGANTVSGDFSLSAKGYLIEDGVKTRAVDQITLAGNFFKLMENVRLVANDLKFFGGSGSPTFAADGLSVGGE